MNSAAVSATKKLTTVSSDGSWKLWDPTLWSAPPAHRARVNAVDLAPDGLHAVSGDQSGVVLVWHLAPASCSLKLASRVQAHAVSESSCQTCRFVF